MKSKILEKDLSFLKLDSSVIEILNNNNINVINDLWCLNRKDLKALKISDKDIHNIIVKLQLNGLDLNKRKYEGKCFCFLIMDGFYIKRFFDQ